MSKTQELLKRLKHFVLAEAKAEYAAIEEQWSKPLSTRVANGWAIEGVSVLKYDNGLVKLHCETNDSRFREGDLIILHRGNIIDPQALHLDIEYDGETELEARLIEGDQLSLAVNSTGWIIDQDILDLNPYYLNALNIVADSVRGRSIILPLLQGEIQNKIDYARYSRISNTLTDGILNERQVEAISSAYAADFLHLIQGPPGTGKTITLAHLAKLLVDDNQRVFVTGFTHRSINNALNKIPPVDPLTPVCKIGDSRQAGDLIVENFENFPDSYFGDHSGGYVVGATPFALYSRRLANVEFDVVLFDEASQITLPLAIMGMLAGNKYIFFGDENQLPPISVISAQQASKYCIFNYLAGRGNETMLNVTYRLNDTLVDWPSKTFYHNELKPSQKAASRRLKLSTNHSRWDFLLDPSAPAVFVDLCHYNTTVRSRNEADVVVAMILALLSHGISPNEIGVVVPYRAQSRLIRSLLRRIINKEDIYSQIIVDTVERMQGQEREVVFVSFATSNLAFATRVAEFLFQPQRLNVAVTRPRTKLILVGSHHMFDNDIFLNQKHEEVFSLLRSLINSCKTFTLPGGNLT